MKKAKYDEIFSEYQKKLLNLNVSFERDLVEEIDWNECMIAIKGARGVGKTTLMLQYIKQNYTNNNQVLYISMDQIQLAGYSIYEIAEYHNLHGGTILFIDEVHKYENWSIELKNIYDTLHTLKVVFSSSSILQIYKGYADLSRRVVSYHLQGLSFREYLQIETRTKLDKYTLEQILENHLEVSQAIVGKFKPLPYFKSYLEHGYFPFYLQGTKTYDQKLLNILNVILEVDLPYILGINLHNVSKLKRLLKTIAGAVPFQPNITKLAQSVDVTRNTLTQYLYYLEQAELINMLTVVDKSYSKLTKPEKIFLQNPNLCYALENQNANIGTIRELFFLNQLKTTAAVNHTKQGDFLVNEKYIFEIGGNGKKFTQIADLENSYLALDDIEIGINNKIPLWMFGFLA